MRPHLAGKCTGAERHPAYRAAYEQAEASWRAAWEAQDVRGMAVAELVLQNVAYAWSAALAEEGARS